MGGRHGWSCRSCYRGHLVRAVAELSLPLDRPAPRIVRIARLAERVLASTVPWFVAFALFLALVAYIRRQWLWNIGDDQNLLMPAINLARGYTPNIDFKSGYPGLTFYVQRLIMALFGDQPISEHIYTALQAALLGGVAAWVLRKWYPATLVWLMVVFLWSVGHATNPTPNPGFMIEPLVLLGMVVTVRVGGHGRLTDAAGAGALAGLAFLFKQYGTLIPVAFVLYTSFACLASPSRPNRYWHRAAVVLMNVGIFAAFFWVYVVGSVLMVPHGDSTAAAQLPISAVTFLSPWVFKLVCLLVLAVRPRPLLPRGLAPAAFARVNLAFGATFVAVAGVAFALMYGANSLTALRIVLFQAPEHINGNIIALRPLQLWPQVFMACLVVIGPLVLKEIRNQVLQMAMFLAIAAVVLYTTRTNTNLSLTLVPTIAFFLLAASYLFARPEGEAWSWFFVFVSGSTMLAYLIPYPYYAFNLGILVTSGWAMMGGTFQSPWPKLTNTMGALALVVILPLALLDSRAAMNSMPAYHVGTHVVKSRAANMGIWVDEANRTSASAAQRELYLYLVYLAHER